MSAVAQPTPLAIESDLAQEQRFVGRSGALLLLLTLLQGGYVAAAMTGQVPADVKITLAAHVTGHLGALFLFAYAWSLPLLRLGATGRKRIAYALVVANFAGLIVGSAKAIPAVHGVALNDNPANNTVFGLLNVLVVIPMLAAAAGWIYGFRK